MYGGQISSILLNIPGDEPAMMTTLDGYPMAKAGRANDALVLSGVASFVGAFLATIGLMLLAPILAQVAFMFGPAEYWHFIFWPFAPAEARLEQSGKGRDFGLPWTWHCDDRGRQINWPDTFHRRQPASV